VGGTRLHRARREGTPSADQRDGAGRPEGARAGGSSPLRAGGDPGE